MKTDLYNQKGEVVGQANLPDSVFAVPFNQALVHQVTVSMLSNQRKPLAHSKERGEVRGGGKKPWAQKGTGRARHGSIRSPLWKGGGVTFGPRKEKNFEKKIPDKMRVKALFCVLSQKVKDKELKILDDLSLAVPKTKQIQEILKNFLPPSKKYKFQKAVLALPKADKNLQRATRNLPFAQAKEARNLNILDLLNYKFLIMPQESVKVIENNFKIKK